MSAQPVPAPASPYPEGPPRRMGVGHWVLIVFGVLLTACGAGLTVGGSILLGGDAAQQNGGYVTSQTERVRTTGYAVTSPSIAIRLGEVGPGAPALGDLATVRIRATAVVPGQAVFVGIAEASKVTEYLRDVPQASLGNVSWPFPGARAVRAPASASGELQPSGGGRSPAAPASQGFWTASASGPGTQELTFSLKEGDWSLVVMNADAARPVWSDLQVGVRSTIIGPVGGGLLTAGLIGLVIGVPLLLFGAAGLGRDIGLPASGAGSGPGATAAQGAGQKAYGVYPVRFEGFLDPQLSRGLWIVKWLLAIPHAIVLAVLWCALFVSTIAAGFAILFTGRYPRPLFSFAVGVLRWTWRVGFYAYSALGTDRYPPFTLASADYPADLEIAYPERLSRGLVLVKWWLLALPHLLIVAALTGSAGTRGVGVWWDGNGQEVGGSGGLSLLGLLVLIAALLVLFTGRYRPELFGFVMGINRWLYRVLAYVLLLRDDYPPFRLDQGPVDPPGPA